MNTIELNIKGFKCFTDSTISLKNLTILTGANSVGKSSTIQALLLLYLARKHYANTQSTQYSLPLHGKMGLELGTSSKILSGEDLAIRLNNDILLYKGNNQDDTAFIDVEYFCEAKNSAFETNLYYLNAERLGPKFVYEHQSSDEDTCGVYGERTAYKWYTHKNDIANSKRWLYKENDTNAKLQVQINEWTKYIFDGKDIDVRALSPRYYQVEVLDSGANMTANNAGFGISYVLPIIIEGLCAQEGDFLIIENPEAHLQPKAQVRMGLFLAKIAASGVRVLIETHSEHIIDAIATATLNDKTIKTDDVLIHYYKKDEGRILISDIPISNGHKMGFPDDFFENNNTEITNIIDLINKSKKDL